MISPAASETASVAKSSAPPGGLLLTEEAKAQFAQSQVEMTRTWFNNLLKSGRNVEDYIALRKAAYLGQWREAGRYFGEGGRVLDVGGGNLYPELLAYFRTMGWDYWYADVGADEVAASSALAAGLGFDSRQFSRRLNHELDYPEASFDAVFSSHCVEHSMDLRLTLQQMHRLLKSGGNAVISVPFGWDGQPNHPYFLSEAEWLSLVEDAGFRVRAYQVGSEYPESGYDLMIAAQKEGPMGERFRLDVESRIKTNYAFRPYRDARVRLTGSRDEKPDHVILDGSNWAVEVALDEGVTEALPIFVHHSWSGVILLRSGGDEARHDLYRAFATQAPVRLHLSAPARAGQILEARPLGKSEISFASQGVFVGVMTR